MIVALDARAVYSAIRRGTGKNLIDLYRRLARLRPDWRFVMLHRGEGPDDPFADLANVTPRRVRCPGDRWDLWQQVRLPLAARAAGADVLHCPANTAPRRPMAPLVVTIHDLIPLEGHGGAPPDRAWERNVAAAARKARRIITPSQYSRRLIVERFGVDEAKVVVNHWAPDGSCRKVTDPAALAEIRRRYGLPPDRPYVLAFGAADPRKNTERILRAWRLLPGPLRDEWSLLLVGIAGPARQRWATLATELGIDGACRLHGFADETDVPALLSGAAVLCYPSLSEGFGLPVLDAFACDTAVLTSTTTSLPEVAGEAAVLVDPSDEQAIAAGLAELLPNESFRADLVERGRARLPKFTWEACAQRACQILQDACA